MSNNDNENTTKYSKVKMVLTFLLSLIVGFVLGTMAGVFKWRNDNPSKMSESFLKDWYPRFIALFENFKFKK